MAKVREHAERRHPEHGWSGEDEATLRATRHASEVLVGLTLLNEERFTWLYMAVQSEQGQRERAFRRNEPAPGRFPAGPADDRRHARQPIPRLLEGTLRLELDQAPWPDGVTSIRMQVLDLDGEEVSSETIEGPFTSKAAARAVECLARLVLQTPAGEF